MSGLNLKIRGIVPIGDQTCECISPGPCGCFRFEKVQYENDKFVIKIKRGLNIHSEIEKMKKNE